jgi:hypothetical protein
LWICSSNVRRSTKSGSGRKGTVDDGLGGVSDLSAESKMLLVK